MLSSINLESPLFRILKPWISLTLAQQRVEQADPLTILLTYNAHGQTVLSTYNAHRPTALLTYKTHLHTHKCTKIHRIIKKQWVKQYILPGRPQSLLEFGWTFGHFAQEALLSHHQWLKRHIKHKYKGHTEKNLIFSKIWFTLIPLISFSVFLVHFLANILGQNIFHFLITSFTSF